MMIEPEVASIRILTIGMTLYIFIHFSPLKFLFNILSLIYFNPLLHRSPDFNPTLIQSDKPRLITIKPNFILFYQSIIQNRGSKNEKKNKIKLSELLLGSITEINKFLLFLTRWKSALQPEFGTKLYFEMTCKLINVFERLTFVISLVVITCSSNVNTKNISFKLSL